MCLQRSIHEMVNVKAAKADLEQQIKKSKRKIRDVIALADVSTTATKDDSLDSLLQKLEASVRAVLEASSGSENQGWCLSNLELAKCNDRILHLETQLRKSIKAQTDEKLRADKLSDTNKSLREQIEEARSAAQHAEKELHRAESECADLRASLDGAQNDLESTSQNHSKILSQTDTLKRDLEESSNTSRRLQELHHEVASSLRICGARFGADVGFALLSG